MLFLVSNRKIYEKNANDQLNIWKSDLELLQAKKNQIVKNCPEDDFQCLLTELSGKFNESKKLVDSMSSAPDHVWDSIKQGYEEVWCQVAPRFYKIKERL